MRGYFGIGVEGLSKPMNAGNLFRSAHAFGASFLFTVAALAEIGETVASDTSKAPDRLPCYEFGSVDDLRLPEGCSLVGVELLDEATALPSFCHPRRAAYILGQERGALSPRMMECLDHVIRIPTRFSLNLAAAGAIVMYDRMISLQRFGARPVAPGGPVEALPEHVFGKPVWRKKQARRNAAGE
jgi:tRNA G18 (ribose-2'-O)-methylase SpoU